MTDKFDHGILENILIRFIRDLVDEPLDNTRYTATFRPDGRLSGSVIFRDKHSERTAEAQWRAYVEGPGIRANLTFNVS